MSLKFQTVPRPLAQNLYQAMHIELFLSPMNSRSDTLAKEQMCTPPLQLLHLLYREKNVHTLPYQFAAFQS